MIKDNICVNTAKTKKEHLKRALVNHLGGCCLLCGYNRCFRALHFHHLNPHEKEFNISEKSTWHALHLEIEKCVLLCANCHAEVESGLIDHEVLAEIGER